MLKANQAGEAEGTPPELSQQLRAQQADLGHDGEDQQRNGNL